MGDPIQVNDSFLNGLLTAELVPVLAPLTHDGKGSMLNTNADTIANFVAVSLCDSYDIHLVYVFELNGVLADINDHSTVVRKLDKARFETMKTNGSIAAGMIPKLDNAFEAMTQGVKKVSIINASHLGELENEEYNAYTRLTK